MKDDGLSVRLQFQIQEIDRLTLWKKYISLCFIHVYPRGNICSNGFREPYLCRLSTGLEYSASIIGELSPSLYHPRSGHPVVTYRAGCTNEIEHDTRFFLGLSCNYSSVDYARTSRAQTCAINHRNVRILYQYIWPTIFFCRLSALVIPLTKMEKHLKCSELLACVKYEALKSRKNSSIHMYGV